jgi:hypothetical protein
MKKSNLFLLMTLSFALSGCAILHQFQMSSIDSETVMSGKKFEIIVSETGVNLQEVTDTAKLFTQSQQTRKEMQQINEIISMFQMGPRTGNMVFNEKYADSIMRAIQLECPTGQISGMTSIRETAKYPVVSGEIVRITGYCQKGS